MNKANDGRDIPIYRPIDFNVGGYQKFGVPVHATAHIRASGTTSNVSIKTFVIDAIDIFGQSANQYFQNIPVDGIQRTFDSADGTYQEWVVDLILTGASNTPADLAIQFYNLHDGPDSSCNTCFIPIKIVGTSQPGVLTRWTGL